MTDTPLRMIGQETLRRWFEEACAEMNIDEKYLDKLWKNFLKVYDARLEARWRGRFHRFLNGKMGLPIEDQYK